MYLFLEKLPSDLPAQLVGLGLSAVQELAVASQVQWLLSNPFTGAEMPYAGVLRRLPDARPGFLLIRYQPEGVRWDFELYDLNHGGRVRIGHLFLDRKDRDVELLDSGRAMKIEYFVVSGAYRKKGLGS